MQLQGTGMMNMRRKIYKIFWIHIWKYAENVFH